MRVFGEDRDYMCFTDLRPKTTGLPFKILVDETGASKYRETHKLRLRMYVGYFCCRLDMHDYVEVDMDGNVYTHAAESEERWNIKYEDFQKLKNFMQNNKYALEMIAQQKVNKYTMAHYLIKDGKPASEAEIERLNELADFFSSDAGSPEMIHRKSYKEIAEEFEKSKAARNEIMEKKRQNKKSPRVNAGKFWSLGSGCNRLTTILFKVYVRVKRNDFEKCLDKFGKSKYIGGYQKSNVRRAKENFHKFLEKFLKSGFELCGGIVSSFDVCDRPAI